MGCKGSKKEAPDTKMSNPEMFHCDAHFPMDINLDRALDGEGTKKIPVIANIPSSSDLERAAPAAPLQLHQTGGGEEARGLVREKGETFRSTNLAVKKTKNPDKDKDKDKDKGKGKGKGKGGGAGSKVVHTGPVSSSSRARSGNISRHALSGKSRPAAGGSSGLEDENLAYDNRVYVLHSMRSRRPTGAGAGAGAGAGSKGAGSTEATEAAEDPDEWQRRKAEAEAAAALPSVRASRRFTLVTKEGGPEDERVSDTLRAELGIPERAAAGEHIYELSPDSLTRACRKTDQAGGTVPLPPAVQAHKDRMFNEPPSDASGSHGTSNAFFEPCKAHRRRRGESSNTGFSIFDV